MNNLKTFFSLMSVGAMLVGCSTATENQSSAPMKVIFETDMGNDVDDALAFDMLMKYKNEGLIDLLAVSTNKSEPGSIEYLDQLTTWYDCPEIPLGNVVNGSNINGANYALSVYNLTDSAGNKLFARSHADDDFIRPSVELYRELLAAQPDTSVTIVSVGYSTNLAQLLNSPADEYSPMPGRDLVAAKVKQLVTMAGEFSTSNDPDTLKRWREYNIICDLDAAQQVFETWPTPIVTSPFELGKDVLYPGKSIEEDFAWAESHPVVEGYKAYMQMPYDRPTWDLTSVLYAVEGLGDYFTLSEPGKITVDHRGVTYFEPLPEGTQRYLMADSIQKATILNRLVELTTSPK